jgi:folate-dependent phosphoribosylglycinamide formyltransferase PurN
MLSRRPLRVALLCSHRAPGLVELLEDVQARVLHELVVCLTTETDFVPPEAARRSAVPLLRHPIREFCARHGAPLRDLEVRAHYDAMTRDLLLPFAPDLVLLSSYLYLLTRPFLEAFPRRVLNVHHADLTLRDAAGRPRYPGLRAVRDAILAGEVETRCTLHGVTADLDAGPPFLRSWPFPVATVARQALAEADAPLLRGYVRAHQEWMLQEGFGRLLQGGVRLMAQRRIGWDNGCGRVDGLPGPLDVARDGAVEWPFAREPRSA